MLARRSRRSALLVCAAALAAVPMFVAPTAGQAADHSSRGATIPQHFVGLSIEWSLVERYMAPAARPAFANLLANLGTGVLRIGGSSQDVMPFDAAAENTDKIITPQDLGDIRSTLDTVNRGVPQRGLPSWGVVLGTAMSPPSATYPFRTPENAHAFVTQGVEPAFSGTAARDVVGIELGNEPDLSYGSNLDRYLSDLDTYSAASVTGPLPVIAPSTSEDILPWTTVAAAPTRYFHDWPQILAADAPVAKARAGAFGAYVSDHFYPLARTCANKPYRCPGTAALLSDEHMDSLDYQVYTHAGEAAADGLGYRLEETSTAAGRGADQVSNVAASATYALDLMFNAACPQPPDGSGANRNCSTGAIGVNFHNAEVNSFFMPQEGNGFYNAIDYDTGDSIGAPTAAPLYYAMLLFSHFAQGSTGLRPLQLPGIDSQLKAWQVNGSRGSHRLFLINKADHPVTASVPAPGHVALIDRMTPYDPTGTGRTLGAGQVRIDGRQVAADGRWPGFAPTPSLVRHDRLPITLGSGEAIVITTHS
jgi:hypothetical protein